MKQEQRRLRDEENWQASCKRGYTAMRLRLPRQGLDAGAHQRVRLPQAEKNREKTLQVQSGMRETLKADVFFILNLLVGRDSLTQSFKLSFTRLTYFCWFAVNRIPNIGLWRYMLPKTAKYFIVSLIDLCPSCCLTRRMSFDLWYSMLANQCLKLWKWISFRRGFPSLKAMRFLERMKAAFRL